LKLLIEANKRTGKGQEQVANMMNFLLACTMVLHIRIIYIILQNKITEIYSVIIEMVNILIDKKPKSDR